MSTPAPPLSPLSIGGGRRLSSRRRGSMAAPDPFGKLPDNERGMSSTLTIIRAPPSPNTNQEAEERARRRSHVRSHSGGSPGGRISFAFTAFTPISPQEGSRRASVDLARPTSPLSTRALPRSNSFTALPVHTVMTPIQVYEVAQQCNYPNSQPPTPGGDAAACAPVPFTSLPDAFYLPFLDRPNEVQVLMSTPPTSKLFSLLAQTLSSPTSLQTDADPSSWTYAQLERWLTKVGRDEADDAEWVDKARICIAARSELIWERVKGALGVPPELDAPHGVTEILASPEPDASGEGIPTEGIEDFEDSFGEAWVEPIVSGSSPLPLSRSPTTSFRRSPSLGRQSMSRMEDISEDAPEPASDFVPPSSPVVHGLRVVAAASEPPARRYSSPSPSTAGSFSHSQVPYDVVADRGPGHPLFPTSFANLALGPTLSAKYLNPALRSPSLPPASAYPLSHSMSRHRRKVPSWAEGFDLQKQEYAVSVASSGSRRSVPVE